VRRPSTEEPTDGDQSLLHKILGLAGTSRPGIVETGGARLIRGRFYVYRYDDRARLEERDEQVVATHGQDHSDPDRQPLCGTPPPFPGPVPPVPPGIEPGRWYVVAELVFQLNTGGGPMNWRALVEVESGAILFLRALTSGVNGFVFIYDPVSSTGVAGNGPDQTAAVLDPLRDDVVLANLDAPVAGVQSLSGSFAELAEIVGPTIAAPTEATGTDFAYSARTNDFAAVNAYYHVDRFFQLVESLGFTTATYFDGTAFPVQVDHRGLIEPMDCPAGNCVNAQCPGDGDGISFVQFALAHTGDTVNPIGIASDWRVVLHELGGHGIMHDHVGTGNFGQFINSAGLMRNRVHSLGDSFAMVLNDWTSEWHNGAAIDRFLLSPFVPTVPRRSDRTIADGWGWGGTNDLGNYNSEQILSTCMFRFYRSIGGDSTSIVRREFCARATSYLMLRAVSTLTAMSNPNTPEGILAALITADAGDWTSEGLAGGAYNKVLTWSFEQQGLGGGAAPAVDVYIDDGRGGQYPHQPVHWANASIWNRLMPDATPVHQEPQLDAVNYAYVEIRNRGTATATGVVVNAYHCKPSAGVTWPNDFDAMSTPSLTASDVDGNDSETVLVGPFQWTPTINGFGHDCMLMIVSATGDPSNVDLLGPGESYADWRLVPNDNNVGQRNVNPAAGGDDLNGLAESLDGKGFWIGNPGRRPAMLDVSIKLPAVLERAGWKIRIDDWAEGGTRAKPGERRLVTFRVERGQAVPRADIAEADDRDILVTATADGAPIGGMVYRLDPDIDRPRNGRDPTKGDGEQVCEEKPDKGGAAKGPILWLILLILLLLLIIAYLLLR
jgi:hypothetical protein